MGKTDRVTPHVFRIFISSTFEDLKEERDALQREVFPRLREFCSAQGSDFQVIDLRWGIAEQAALNQQTVNICLEEIDRCQKLSPKPNFLVMLGDRYGWCPPPPQIPAGEFEQLLKAVSPQNISLLEEWYRRDDNAVPPEYCLQPREVGGAFESLAAWQPIEEELHKVLLEAALDSGFDGDSLAKFRDSATHQEITAGALSVPDAEDHVLCFFRNIQDFPDQPIKNSYLDFKKENGQIIQDLEANKNLHRLRETLRDRLGRNVFEYPARWEGDQPSQEHLEKFCSDVYQNLKRIIIQSVQQGKQIPAADLEQEAHRQHLAELARGFRGREEILSSLQEEFDKDLYTPMILWGQPGSGKSATLAKFIQQYQDKHRDAEVIFRFAGATTSTSDTTALISGLCQQIQERFNFDQQKKARLEEIPLESKDLQTLQRSIELEYHIPSDLRGLLVTFSRFLEFASRLKPLIVVIDGLDSLESTSVAQFVRWVPGEFSTPVKMMLSFSSGNALCQIQERLPEIRQIKMEPLSRRAGKEILTGWLEDAHRNLQPGQEKRVLDHFLAGGEGLPLYLKMVFEQACRWKSYADPDQTVIGADINQVIDSLFDQLSTNENHGPVLVSRTIAYLNTSRRGLSEDELLDLLSLDPDLYSWFIQNLYHFPSDLKQAIKVYLADGDPRGMEIDDRRVNDWFEKNRDNPDSILEFLADIKSRGASLRLPIVLWSRLYADLKPYLVLKEGDGTRLLGLSSKYLQEQGKSKFLTNSEARLLHQRTATYFSEQSTFLGDGIINQRKLSELPYQQTRGGLFDSLKETLLDFEFLDAKVQAFGPEPLLADFRRSETSGFMDDTLQIIESVLKLSAHVLDLDPKQMPSQLTGRLSAIDQEQIQAFLAEVNYWKGRAWLRPLSSSLRSPGGALLRKYSEFRGRQIGLPDGSVLIGNEQGDISQISIPDYSIEPRLLAQAAQLNPLGLDASGCQVLIREGENRLCVSDLESADSLRLIGETGGQIESAARIPGAAIIFISTSDGILEAWDLGTSQRLFLLPKIDSPIVELLPMQSPQCVISVHRDGTIRRWGVSSQKELIEGDVFAIPLTWGGDRVTAAAQGAGDAELMLGFGDGTIGFFDLGGQELTERFKIHSEWVTSFSLFPEGNLCLSGAFDGSLIVWDLESGTQLSRYEGHNHPIESITILPDARVAFSSTNYDLKCWDLTSAEIQQQGEQVTALALTPDGKKAVAASDTRYAWSRAEADTILSVVDLATGRVENRVNLGRHFWVNDLDVFSDNRRVMCACMYWQQSLMIFDLKTGKPILPLPYDRSSFSVQIDKDGSTVISGGEDSTVRIWDLDAFNEVACLQGHDGEVTAVCLYDRGTKALSASVDHTLRIWDLEDFQQLKVIETKAGFRAVKDIQVMDSGRFALTTGEAIQLWDLEQGVLITTLPIKTGSSLHLSWSDEKNPLISGTDGRKFCVIDPTSGELIADFWGEGEGMSCSASGPDGSTFVAGGSAGAVHVLELVIPDV